ncbi:MAG: hypothetical protein NC548_10845 [Lachnospiraceae bacterium]|nr:hypothetical protein [Lachnospiraceae bacterium]
MKQVYKCPMCGRKTELEVDENAWDLYQSSGKPVQECFPESNAFFRETLINGTCYDCQSKTFHRPKPGDEDKWGSEIGECANCGCPAFEIDRKDGNYMCPQCGCTELYD